MRNFKTCLLAGCLAVMFLFSAPTQQSRADNDFDDYWGNYWNWYDGRYRPYYNRFQRFRRYPNWGYYQYPPYYRGYYGNPYGYPDGGYGYGYGYPFSGYGYPRYNGVQLGPLHRAWR